MVGTSRDGCITVQTESWLELQEMDVSRQNNGWNFKKPGYITVETESWLELQRTDVSQ